MQVELKGEGGLIEYAVALFAIGVRCDERCIM